MHTGELLAGFSFATAQSIVGTDTTALTGGGGHNIRDIMVDAAGNVVSVNSASEALRVHSPPDGPNNFNTLSPWAIDVDNGTVIPRPKPAPQLAISIMLIPINPPIQIPAAGGQFGFTLNLTNNSAIPQTFQVWNMIMLPNGETVGPTVGPVNPTLGAGETISVTLTQNIPGAPPAGQYTYIFNIGTFPNTINDSDSFQFTKLNAPSALHKSSSGETDNWAVIGADGWESLIVENKIEVLPEGFELEQNYPNPFNPETEIRFQLPQASQVLVRIFNTLGQEIRTLTDREYEAGFHSVRWDAKDNKGNLVSSGIYLYQLKAGVFSQIKKMSLIR